MATTQVKQTSRTSKRGSRYVVRAHSRDYVAATGHRIVSSKIKRVAAKVKAATSISYKDVALDVVTDKKKAKQIVKKYAGRAANIKMMVSAKWKDVKVKKWVTDEAGNRKRTVETERHISLSPQEFNALIRANEGLIHKEINRIDFRHRFTDDLKQEAMRAIWEAANNYEAKYNPMNPPDIYRHFLSQARGMVRAEMSKQVATNIRMPSYKARLYGDFKRLRDLFGGDWKKIFNEMSLTKKDLYPALAQRNPKEAEEPLPWDGYVTISTTEGGTMAEKLKKYETRMNTLKKEHVAELDRIKDKRDSATEEDKNVLDIGLKHVDKIRKKTLTLMAMETDKGKLAAYQSKLKSLQKRQDGMIAELRPLSEQEYGAQVEASKASYQTKLKDAKKKFDDEAGKSTISGAKRLFVEFEDILSFKEYNLSQGLDDAGEEMNFEEMIAEPEKLPMTEEIALKLQYKFDIDRFNDVIDMMSPEVSEVYRMHMGLSDRNDLYAHGLWGVPMRDTEIVYKLPKDHYKRDDNEVYLDRRKSWRGKKPGRVQTITRPKAEYGKLSRAWKIKRQTAQSQAKKHIASHPNMTQSAKTEMRAKMYTKHKSNIKDQPWKTKVVNKPSKQYAGEVATWKKNEPQKHLSTRSLLERIKHDIDLADITIRRLAKPDEIRSLRQSYVAMRRYGLSAPTDKMGFGKAFPERLSRSLQFDHSLGFTYAHEVEDSIIVKAYNKFKGIAESIIKMAYD